MRQSSKSYSEDVFLKLALNFQIHFPKDGWHTYKIRLI